MKNEERILELLIELLRRADHTDEQVVELKERFNKVEWRHDDLTLKMQELRYEVTQTNRAVNALTQAVAAQVNAQAQLDARVRHLERPDDAASSQVA